VADRLKDLFNVEMVRRIAAEIRGAYPALKTASFVRECVAPFDALELTPRAAHVAVVLERHLPSRYPDAVGILVRSLAAEHEGTEGQGFAPFRYLPHTMFVARYGLDHLEESLAAQYELTKRFTAEFSIRPFLERHREATLARLHEWTRDPNPHVRRLVSEGTRPRLPWAPRLRDFQRDPAPVLALLEALRDDPERYVQRSVANNLNDIGKDHPATVVATCRRWLQSPTPTREWIVGHALRSLVKQGHTGALDVMGTGSPPAVRVESVQLEPRVAIGDALRFQVTLASASKGVRGHRVSEPSEPQQLTIDFAVHFVKRDGTRRPKVFKLRRLALGAGESVELGGRVSFAPLTTRTPYAGTHALELRVNGLGFPLGEFEVVEKRRKR